MLNDQCSMVNDRDGRDEGEFEVYGTSNPDLQPSARTADWDRHHRRRRSQSPSIEEERPAR